jgi:hypothetical protein
MKMPHKPKSTYEKELEEPRLRRLFEKECSELVLSELILAMMEEDTIHLRKLAK